MHPVFKRNFFKILIAGIFITSPVFASQYYSVSPGATVTVNEWGVCQKVTNAAGWPTTFIPTNSAAEWSAFCSYHPSHITLSPCGGFPSGATVTVWYYSCAAHGDTYAISSLPRSWTTPSGQQYTMKVVNNDNILVEVRRNGGAYPALNVYGVRINHGSLPGGGVYANRIVSYVVGTNGLAWTRDYALGDPSKFHAWFTNGQWWYCGCTWMGNTYSNIVVGFPL